VLAQLCDGSVPVLSRRLAQQGRLPVAPGQVTDVGQNVVVRDPHQFVGQLGFVFQLTTAGKIAKAVLWFFLALLNTLAVAVLLAGVPGVGALPALIGLALVPWWVGLIVIVLYAIGRSFFPKGGLDSWKLIYNS